MRADAERLGKLGISVPKPAALFGQEVVAARFGAGSA